MKCVVVGAGPAGLSAAWQLRDLGIDAVVVESAGVVGGLSRTVVHEGFRFDVGGHRFFTKVPEVQALWQELLGDDLLLRDRLSRILYRGRFFDYPLRPANALRQLGPLEATRVLLSYVATRLSPPREEKTFEDWVSRRFGRRLYEIFFKTYSEKVWGIPCNQIDAAWAAQRIRDVDLIAMLRHALFGPGAGPVATTLIDRFHYPRLGPGMMWERVQKRLAQRGVETLLRTSVTRIRHAEGRVRQVEVREPDGNTRWIECDAVISSMPLAALARCLDPGPPADVCQAASGLKHRAFLCVGVIVERAELFPDNWIYVHSPHIRMGRIQNFKNWSPDMVPDPRYSSLGLEYFVNEGDALWRMSDSELVELGRRECEELGLARRAEIRGGITIRMPHAYPVYDPGYAERIGRIRSWLNGIGNLQTVGRNGQHRYNNQDHAMLTGLFAARNLAGAQHDVWSVNLEPEYVERPAERLAPRPIASAPRLRPASPRFNPVTLGVGTGATAAALSVATAAWGNSLPLALVLGQPSTWGAPLAMLAGAVGGFGLGFVLAATLNAVAFRRTDEP